MNADAALVAAGRKEVLKKSATGGEGRRSRNASFKKAFALVLPSSVILFNLMLVMPAMIFSGNAGEFDIGLPQILKCYIWPGGGLVLALILVSALVSDSTRKRLAVMLCAIGLLLWVQGNFLVWRYGLLNGQAIDWSQYSWRGWIDGPLWVAAILVSLYRARRLFKAAVLVSAALIAVQSVSLVVLTLQGAPLFRTTKESALIPPEGIFQFGDGTNILHLVLDAFQADLFDEIVSQDPRYWEKELDGFVFYENASGVFATTYMSIPASLTGKLYANDMPMERFVDTVLRGKSIGNVLHEQGYAVDYVHAMKLYVKGKADNTYVIPARYHSRVAEHEWGNAAFMMDLVLFRCLPHWLKRFVYNDQMFLFSRWTGNEGPRVGGTFRQLAHRAFLENFAAKMSIGREKPTYKFLHLISTHPPIILNENCEFGGHVYPQTRPYYLTQDRCALEQVSEILEQLKELGLYDKSLIIVQADTGAGLPVDVGDVSPGGNSEISPRLIGNARPLLVVKMPGSRGPMKRSRAPVSLTDIPATVASVAGIRDAFPGEAVIRIDPSTRRQRKYYHYNWRAENWQSTYFKKLDEYVINGNVGDPHSWELAGIILDPRDEDSFQADRIDFGREAFSQFLLSGWGSNESSAEDGSAFNWALGRSAKLCLRLPRKAVRLLAEMRPYPFESPLEVRVSIDGEEIALWRLERKWQWQTFGALVPPNLDRPDVSIVKFAFSQSRQGPGRPLSTSFRSLTLDKKISPRMWGSVIRFGENGDSDAYRSIGWSQPTGDHCWNDGRRAVLSIPIQDTGADRVSFKFVFSAFIVPGKVDKQLVDVYVDGARIDQWVIDRPGLEQKVLEVPAELLKTPSFVTIRLDVPNAVSPREIGYNEDSRLLAIAMRQVELMEAPSDAPRYARYHKGVHQNPR